MDEPTPWTTGEIVRMMRSIAAYDALNHAIAAMRVDGAMGDHLPPTLLKVYVAAVEDIYKYALPNRVATA